MPGQFSETLAAASAVSYRMPWGTIKGLCWGNPKDIKYVCTHGWLDNAHSFLPLAQQYLRNNAMRTQGGLLALDWAGHGLSDHRPAGTHYHFIDYAYDLWSLLEQQKWQDIVLVGHSMGGFVSNVTASLVNDCVTWCSLRRLGYWSAMAKTRTSSYKADLARDKSSLILSGEITVN